MSRSVYVALVRHAPTAWNAEGRAQGRADMPLSPEGQARLVRWHLPHDLRQLAAGGQLGWATSPLRRAVETARGLGADRPMVEPRLLERDYGAWTGRLLGDLDSPEEGTSGPGWDHRPPSGESSAEVVRRARAWLDELAEGQGPETWIAVTHKGVIRTLIAAAVRWDLCAPEPFRLLPERLHRIRRRGDGLLQLVTLNEPLVDTLEIEPAPAPKPSSPPQ